MGRRPNRDERALWRRATGDVAPLRRERRAVEPEDEEPSPAPAPRRAVARPTMPSAAPLPPLASGVAVGVDRRTAEKLRRGQMAMEARLDLHGLTLGEAHRALVRFLPQAQAEGRRAVLVITGKGSAGAGVIRASTPRWLNEPALRPLILSFSEAQPKHGGAGALYVLLKRRR